MFELVRFNGAYHKYDGRVLKRADPARIDFGGGIHLAPLQERGRNRAACGYVAAATGCDRA